MNGLPAETDRTDLQHSISSAVGFLCRNQLPYGEFKDLEDTGTDLNFHSSVFVTSLAIYSIGYARDVRVPEMIERALGFLLGEMEGPGLWRYYSSRSERRWWVPPDIDDTCCASYVLRASGVDLPSNAKIILANRTRHRLFYTWFVPRGILQGLMSRIALGRALYSSQRLSRFGSTVDDVDLVVNANAVLYLGENENTRQTVDCLVRAIREEREEEHSLFYAHKLSFYYMLSRAYLHSAPSLGVIKNLVIERVCGMQQEDGSFANELLAALAACTLMNFDSRRPSLRSAVDYLLSTQNTDGAWPRIPMYGGNPQNRELYGSQELTTSFCIEALSRYLRLPNGEAL